MTLVEVLLSVTIASLIIGIPIGTLQSSFSLWEKGKAMMEMDEDSRLALQWLTQDLHEAKTIQYAGTNQIDLVRFDDQQIRYYLKEGTRLMRVLLPLADPPQEGTLLTDLTHLRFTFRDEAGEIVPDPGQYPSTGIDPGKLSSVRLVAVWARAARRRARADLWSGVKTGLLY